MLCEKVLGKLSDEKFKDLKVDYVDIDWYDAFKKLHKKVSVEGREVGIRLDNDILTKGLNQDDVLGVDGRYSCCCKYSALRGYCGKGCRKSSTYCAKGML